MVARRVRDQWGKFLRVFWVERAACKNANPLPLLKIECPHSSELCCVRILSRYFCTQTGAGRSCLSRLPSPLYLVQGSRARTGECPLFFSLACVGNAAMREKERITSRHSLV